MQRAVIEASAKKEQTVENLKTSPAQEKQKTSENTAKNNNAPTTSDVVSKAGDATDGSEKIKAAEKVKRRAAVRAMMLERIRHPVGEPFE